MSPPTGPVEKMDRSSFMESPVYSASTSTVTPLIARPPTARSLPQRALDGFRRQSDPYAEEAIKLGVHGKVFDPRAAASNTAGSPLVRRLKGRHLQMIALGGSIGTGLFVGSGGALATGGPASLLLAFVLFGSVLFCTLHALGEMAVAFPVAGSFSAFVTRFLDPAWGFAIGWNYALQWLVTLPLEIMAAAITLEFWSSPIPEWVSITFFLVVILAINFCSVKTFGEAEYAFSILKVVAVIGFILLGIIINCGGGQDSGYIGGKFWADPGAFNHGFKGFASVLVTAAFSFAGTELVGLAAAETHNPSKSLPTAIKQVFWRIVLFYVVSIGVMGLLVPYTSPDLISRDSVDAKASPFIIAIKDAGIGGLDSVMNAVVLVAVLSVANSSMYGATRTLAALAEQGQAPTILAYIDKKGRPLVSLAIAAAIALLSYLHLTSVAGSAFTWLIAISGLSSVFTWLSICFAHIRFRQAWALQGHLVSDLVYQSPIGSIGSWIGLVCLSLVLVAQFWVAVDPIGDNGTVARQTTAFFEQYLAMPVVLLSYLGYKFRYKTEWIKIKDIDLKTGRNEFEADMIRNNMRVDKSMWPRWKVLYKTLC
ncbi:amino acid permease [Phlyctema vagabunda]|uniref:Amino acid permease n=1 Tax=Phlyctema vagabunda TaxID=108571 RepID=A0ABR4PUG8_9HELO